MTGSIDHVAGDPSSGVATVRVRTGCRLHFGLFCLDPSTPRQFGGLGLMIDRPGYDLCIEEYNVCDDDRPMLEVVGDDGVNESECEAVAMTMTRLLDCADGPIGRPGWGRLRVRIGESVPNHIGLGSGTQRALTLATALASLDGVDPNNPSILARWTGRGRRSGVGLHGFLQGGLIVDGGRPRDEPGRVPHPPLLARHAFPESWTPLIVRPPRSSGLHGEAERVAFGRMSMLDDARSDRLCRLVLTGLLPSVVERNLPSFATSLEEIQAHVGAAFAPWQGGQVVRAELSPIVEEMRHVGLIGLGQSSWGPVLFGWSPDEDPERRSAIRSRLLDRLGWCDPHRVSWSKSRNITRSVERSLR